MSNGRSILTSIVLDVSGSALVNWTGRTGSLAPISLSLIVPFPANMVTANLRTMHRSHETLVSSICKRRKRVTRSPVLPREKGPGWCRRRLVAMRYNAGRRVAGLQPVPQWRLRGLVRILTLSMDREYTETQSRHIKNADRPQRIDIELDGEEEGGVVH